MNDEPQKLCSRTFMRSSILWFYVMTIGRAMVPFTSEAIETQHLPSRGPGQITDAGTRHASTAPHSSHQSELIILLDVMRDVSLKFVLSRGSMFTSLQVQSKSISTTLTYSKLIHIQNGSTKRRLHDQCPRGIQANSATI